MGNTPNNAALQSKCTVCGQPGIVPTIQRQPDNQPTLGIAFIDDVPKLVRRACRDALADQRRFGGRP